MTKIDKPEPGEYAPYAITYIDLLPDDGLVLDHLRANLKTTSEFIRSVPEEKLIYRYAKDKWTIKDILVHIIDVERIYTYRALRFARSDNTKLPGFEQDDYTRYTGANDREIDNILSEFTAVRESTIALFTSFDGKALRRSGAANGQVMSVRAAAHILAGHELHHMKIIRERYL